MRPQPQSNAAPASPRIREKRRRRRAEILRAALHAFRDKGYHQTTLEDIAAHLGVGKTALYHYFWDKESILYACHRESLAELGRVLRSARASGAPVPEQLARLIREHVHVMTETLEGSPLAFEVTALSPARRRKPHPTAQTGKGRHDAGPWSPSPDTRHWQVKLSALSMSPERL